jgi:multiple sugar transport system substrate-binding protein
MSQHVSISRRHFLRLSGGLSAGALLTACAPGAAPASPDAGQATVNITLFVFEEGEGDTQSPRFMEAHPGVNIEIIPALGEETKLMGMISAGTPPDIYPCAEVDFIDHLSAGNLLNLQPYVDADSEFDLTAFFPNIVATSQSPDGDLYALGIGFGAQLLFYNQSLFDEAGLSYPNETWNWQNMQEAAQQLTKGEGAEKQYGTMSHNAWYVQHPLIWQNGGDVFSADGAQCLIDSPEAAEALEYMVSYVRGELAPTPQQVSGMGMESGQLFAAGRAAMFPGGHWESPAFGPGEGFEWGVTAVPAQKEAATFLHLVYWGVSAATAEPNICWEWIKFWCVEENERTHLEYGGQSNLIAVAERLATDPPEEAVASGRAKVWKALYDSAQRGRADTRVRGFLEIMDSVWDPTIDMLWSGENTAEQAVQEIAEGATVILQREA